MKVSFQAISSGDYECFCFAVDLATFVGIMHREPEECEEDKFHKGTFTIYPDKFFPDGKKYNITIEVEEVKE